MSQATNPPLPPGRLLVELYSDFDCQFCRASVQAVDSARGHFGGRVAWRYRYAANPSSSLSTRSAAIGICTEDETGPWALYKELASVDALSPAAIEAAVVRVHPDPNAVDACAAADSTQERLWTEIFRAAALGKSRTPTLVAGGVTVVGKLSATPLIAFIDERLRTLGAQAGNVP